MAPDAGITAPVASAAADAAADRSAVDALEVAEWAWLVALGAEPLVGTELVFRKQEGQSAEAW